MFVTRGVRLRIFVECSAMIFELSMEDNCRKVNSKSIIDS